MNFFASHRNHRMRHLRLVPVVALAAAIAGCGDDPRGHHVDTIYLTPEQEKDVFLASTDNLGPETSVVVLAEAPKARYVNGAIVISNGRELRVVQPHAWRTYTGTALSAEEARRMIDRAERLDQSLRDVGAAADDLRRYLDERTDQSKRASEQLDENEKRLREDAERSERARDDDAATVMAERDRELDLLTAERDAEIAAATTSLADRQRQIDERHAKRVATLADDQRRADDDLVERQRLDDASARDAGKDAAWLMTLDERHREERADADAAQARAVAALDAQRAGENESARTESATAVDHARRLHDDKAERVRRLRGEQLSRIRDARELAARRSTAPLKTSEPVATP